MATIEQGVAALALIAKNLKDTRELKRGYATELLRQSQRNAVRRPTPQARMTAQGMRISRGGGAVLGFPSTRVLTGGESKRMGGFSFGSEYGSNTHRQFAPRNESGYWLTPSIEQVNDNPGERWLDAVLNDSLRGIR